MLGGILQTKCYLLRESQPELQFFREYTGGENLNNQKITDIGEPLQTLTQRELLSTFENMGDANNTTVVNLDYTYYNIVFQAYGYISAILYPSGFVLNLLSILVLFKIKLHQTAVGLHLIFIGMTDVVCMINGITYSYPLQELVGIKPTDYVNKIFCKVLMTIGYPVTRAGGLLITSATCERFLSVAFPLHVKSWPMLTASKIIIGIISLIAVCETVMWLVVYTDDKCWSNSFSGSFKEIYQMSYSIFWIVTAGLVLLLSILIICFLSAHTRESKNSVLQRKQTKITVMLLIIAVTFLLSTIPELLSFIAAENYEDVSQITVDIWTAAYATTFLYDFYHWCNFFIYLAFLEQFRDGFMSIFCRRCKSVEGKTSGSSSKGDQRVTSRNTESSTNNSVEIAGEEQGKPQGP